jgi:hypothetical protein
VARVPPPPPSLVVYGTLTTPALPPVRVTVNTAAAPSRTEYVGLENCSEPGASSSVIVTVATLCGPSIIPVGPGVDKVTTKLREPSTIAFPNVGMAMTWLVTRA